MDQNHGIRAPGQARHLYLSMTDFLLNDCWHQQRLRAAAPSLWPGVAMTTTLVAMTTSLVTPRYVWVKLAHGQDCICQLLTADGGAKSPSANDTVFEGIEITSEQFAHMVSYSVRQFWRVRGVQIENQGGHLFWGFTISGLCSPKLRVRINQCLQGSYKEVQWPPPPGFGHHTGQRYPEGFEAPLSPNKYRPGRSSH